MNEEYVAEEPAVEEIEEPAVEVESEAVVEEIAVEEAPVKKPSRRAAPVVEEVDEVAPVEEVEAAPSGPVLRLSALVYHPTRKNSESVAVLQKRLSDVGYAAARSDLRGWFHDGTREALVKWQTENGLEVTGECAFDDMRFLFDGTDVEILS